MTRLSVMLRPRYKEALELIARDRATSLSQALEFLIAVGARNYEIDGKKVMDIVVPPDEGAMHHWPDNSAAFREATYLAFDRAKRKEPLSKEDYLQMAAKSPAVKVLKMPTSLRRPDEVFFVAVFESLSEETQHSFLADIQLLDELFHATRGFFDIGVPLEDVVDRFKRGESKLDSEG